MGSSDIRSVANVLVPVANVSMRALGLIGRFLLTAYIAKYFDVKSLGQFGLLLSLTAVAPAVLGFGLNYTFGRKIAKQADEREAFIIIFDRLKITLAACIFGNIAFFLVSFAIEMPAFQKLWIIIVIVNLEVILFDCHYSLISAGNPIFANFLLFVRGALWVFPAVVIGLLFPVFRTVDFVVWFWVAGLVLNLAIFAVYLIKKVTYVTLRNTGLRFPKHIEFSGKIFFSDLVLVSFLYLDRFLIAFVLGVTTTGIYTFFWSLANGVQVLISAAVVQTAAPRLIRSFAAGGSGSLNQAFKQELVKLIRWAGCLLGLALPVVWILLPSLSRQELIESYKIFPLMLATIIVRSINELLATVLYAKSQDKAWVILNLINCFGSLGLLYIGLRFGGLLVGCLALLLSSLAMLVIRSRLNGEDLR